jgi:hypothetical protein
MRIYVQKGAYVATILLRSVFHSGHSALSFILPKMANDSYVFSLILKPWLPNFNVLTVFIADWFCPLTGLTCRSTHYSLTLRSTSIRLLIDSNMIDTLLILALIKFFFPCLLTLGLYRANLEGTILILNIKMRNRPIVLFYPIDLYLELETSTDQICLSYLNM